MKSMKFFALTLMLASFGMNADDQTAVTKNQGYAYSTPTRGALAFLNATLQANDDVEMKECRETIISLISSLQNLPKGDDYEQTFHKIINSHLSGLGTCITEYPKLKTAQGVDQLVEEGIKTVQLLTPLLTPQPKN
jgi:hypothetical protein